MVSDQDAQRVAMSGTICQAKDKIAGDTLNRNDASNPPANSSSTGESYSVGLGSFRFLFYRIHVGICLVFARFLSITFQRLTFR